MSQNRVTFQDALTNAQKLGYAEREPSMDIDGFDTACKVVILANWILNKKITLKDVDRTGIRDVSLEALDEASKRGNTIKLIGSIEGDKATVKPTEIPKNNPLCVSGVLNAITFSTEFAGEQTLVGRGAGGIETASAVLRDLLDIRHKLANRMLNSNSRVIEMKLVMKFGGTSVGTGENIRHVADLVTKYAKKDCNVVVVVSALAGVTNNLLEIACQAKKSNEKALQTFTKELLKKHIDAISTAITMQANPKRRYTNNQKNH